MKLQYVPAAIFLIQHQNKLVPSNHSLSNQTMRHKQYPTFDQECSQVTKWPEHLRKQKDREQHYQLYILHMLKLFIQKHYAMSSLDHKMY